jgi:hypothetical protein
MLFTRSSRSRPWFIFESPGLAIGPIAHHGIGPRSFDPDVIQHDPGEFHGLDGQEQREERHVREATLEEQRRGRLIDSKHFISATSPAAFLARRTNSFAKSYHVIAASACERNIAASGRRVLVRVA